MPRIPPKKKLKRANAPLEIENKRFFLKREKIFPFWGLSKPPKQKKTGKKGPPFVKKIQKGKKVGGGFFGGGEKPAKKRPL